MFSDAYCVTSEEGGEVMLSMLVCRPCYDEARRIGLRTQHIPAAQVIDNNSVLQ